MQNLEKYAILNTYNTNCALSQVLLSQRNGTVVKYIYGVGLIGEERHGYFQTYHYDYRGSTVAITNECGEITDTFEYDTYGNVTGHIGSTFVIFGYNGRDGVITDKNGLVYMRARYYSPEMKRFINADIIPGEISNAITLNRYAYANGNPVSNVDPFGLSVDSRTNSNTYNENEIVSGDEDYYAAAAAFLSDALDVKDDVDDVLTFAIALELENAGVRFVKVGDFVYIRGDYSVLRKHGITKNRVYANKLGKYSGIANMANPSTIWKNGLKNAFKAPGIILDFVGAGASAYHDASQYDTFEDQSIVFTYTLTTELATAAVSTVASVGTTALVAAAAAKIGGTIGTVLTPGVGTAIGAVVGYAVGTLVGALFDWGKEKYIDEIVENN